VLTTQLGAELKRREGEKLRRRAVGYLVANVDALAGILLSAWKWVRETLEGEGFEGQELARHCQVLLEGIDRSLSGYEQLLELAAASGLTPEAAGLHDLEAKLPALREARPHVAAALALAGRLPRPLDDKMLAESQSALERGEFVTLDDDYLDRSQPSAGN
jgi:hypothetical protein